MKYYGVFSIVPETLEVTFSTYYKETDWKIQQGYFEGERRRIDGTVDNSDNSVWYYVEVDEDEVDEDEVYPF